MTTPAEAWAAAGKTAEETPPATPETPEPTPTPTPVPPAEPAALVPPNEPEMTTEQMIAALAELPGAKELMAKIVGPGETKKETPATPAATPPTGWEKTIESIRSGAEKLDDEAKGLINLMADMLEQSYQRTDRVERVVNEQAVEKFLRGIESETNTAKETVLVGGKPVTDAQLDQALRYMEENPEVARTMTVTKVLRVLFDDATIRPSVKPPTTAPAVPMAPPTEPAATIIPGGGAAGTAPATTTTNGDRGKSPQTSEQLARSARALFGLPS